MMPSGPMKGTTGGKIKTIRSSWNEIYYRKKALTFVLSSLLLDCHCAGRTFPRIPLLISSMATAFRSHQATTCSCLVSKLQALMMLNRCLSRLLSIAYFIPTRRNCLYFASCCDLLHNLYHVPACGSVKCFSLSLFKGR